MEVTVLCTESCSLIGFGGLLDPVKHDADFHSPSLAPEMPTLSSLPKLPPEMSCSSRDPPQRELHEQHFSGTPVLPLPPSAALKEKGKNRAFLCKRALSLLKHAFGRILRQQREQNSLHLPVINLYRQKVSKTTTNPYFVSFFIYFSH